MIVEEVGKEAYRLEHLDDRRVPHTWNSASLRIYYNGRPIIPQTKVSKIKGKNLEARKRLMIEGTGRGDRLNQSGIHHFFANVNFRGIYAGMQKGYLLQSTVETSLKLL
ncbi:hypothetical protein CR513_12494, partial [Mucuna pruriens]